jgi:hypothetical protein
MRPNDTSLDHGDHTPARDEALKHATRLILKVCRIVGAIAIIDDAGGPFEDEEVAAVIRSRNTALLFDWLVATLSYQGVSDQVASDYMERHGQATWHMIETDLARRPSCPKLRSYWHFHDCRYNKLRYTCAEPDHLAACPLPKHWLRNGRLNQAAYSLFLFVRDIEPAGMLTRGHFRDRFGSYGACAAACAHGCRHACR